MLSSQFMIIDNKEDLYFVDLIDNMKWNMKFVWFKLLIKWEKYEQKTYKCYEFKCDWLIKQVKFNDCSFEYWIWFYLSIEIDFEIKHNKFYTIYSE